MDIRFHQACKIQRANSHVANRGTQNIVAPQLNLTPRALHMSVKNSRLILPSYYHGSCLRNDTDVVCFDIEKQAECAPGGFLAVSAVAGVAKERGSEQPVTDRVTDTTARYCGERLRFRHDVYFGILDSLVQTS